MSTRFTSASSQAAIMTASAPDYNGDYSALVWVKFATLAANQQVFNVGGSAAGSDYDTLMYLNSTTRLACRVSIATVNDDAQSGSAPSVDTWYCMAMVRRSVTQIDFYWGASAAGITLAGSVPATQDVTARAASAGVRWGVVGAATNPLNGSIAGCKIWTRELSLSELQAEAAYFMPVSYVNIWAAYAYRDPYQVQDFTRQQKFPAITAGPLTAGTDDPPGILWADRVRAETAIQPCHVFASL